MPRCTPTSLSHAADAVDQSKHRRPARDHRARAISLGSLGVPGPVSFSDLRRVGFEARSRIPSVSALPRSSPQDLAREWHGPLPGGAGGGWPLKCLILSPRQAATMVGTPPDQARVCQGHPPPGLSHAARGRPRAAGLADGSARGEPWTMPSCRSDRAGTLWRIFPRGR